MYRRRSITTGIAGISITTASAGIASSAQKSRLQKCPAEAGLFAALKQLPERLMHS
jgi:hypothetical protein